jgi:NADPH:quinone reductase
VRAILLTAYLGPGALELAEVEEPTDASGISINVHAAGVGFPDLLTTRGLYQVRPEPPFTPGLEVAGIVRAAPPGSKFRAGDRVAAGVPMGGYAEVAIARPERVVPIPTGMDFAAATALPVNYMAAYLALARRAQLVSGEVILVHGAGGGTGTAAVEVATWLGATVIGVASSSDRQEAARLAGAQHVLDGAADWRRAILDILGGSRVDVVFDPVGDDRVLEESLRVMAPEGRYLVIGFASGKIAQVAVNRLLIRNVSIVGAYLGGLATAKPDLMAQAAAALSQMHAEGRLRPVVQADYQLADAGQALTDLENRRVVGKLALIVRP